MRQAHDALLAAFLADSRQRIASYGKGSACLTGLSGEADTDLLTRAFHTAHSIRGASRFLGLRFTPDIAQGLGIVLFLLREGDIPVTPETRAVLAHGWELLDAALGDLQTGREDSVAVFVEEWKSLLPGAMREPAERTVEIPRDAGQSPFAVNALCLAVASRGGNRLYRIEFDLIGDIQRQERTPLDVLGALLDAGMVLDCGVDLAAVGEVKDTPSRRIPFPVLIATLIDPEVIGLLFGLSRDRIVPARFDASGSPSAGADDPEGPRRIRLWPRETVERVEVLKAQIVQGFADSGGVLLDPAELREADVAFLQLVAVAARTARRTGRTFGFTRPPGPAVQARFSALGLDPLGGAPA